MKLVKFGAAFVACMVSLACLAGCQSQDPAQAKRQAENRNYMSQVNQEMDQLKDRMKSFDEAVVRGDVVGMKTQSENAFKVIDKFNSIEAPEDLKKIKSGYEAGLTKLKDALSQYVELYTEVDAAGGKENAQQVSDYATKLAEVQKLYTEGMKDLSDTDQLAAKN